MTRLANLSYVVFGVSDLTAWEAFAVDILGLQCSSRGEDALGFRMDDQLQRVIVAPTGQDDLVAAGWDLETAPALEAYVAGLHAKGLEVREGDGALTAARRVEKLYFCDDPVGYRHEFVFGAEQAQARQPFYSTVVSSAGFVAGALGVGHILVFNRDNPAAVAFYRDGLGLSVSDYIRERDPSGFLVDATFFHAGTGRHHSLATAGAPAPKRLNHFMVQVQAMDDVGLAYDRCVKAGLPLVTSLGHHPNDKMFSFYVKSPSGFNIEFGWGGIVIDETDWRVVSYSQLSDWGHQRFAPRTADLTPQQTAPQQTEAGR